MLVCIADCKNLEKILEEFSLEISGVALREGVKASGKVYKTGYENILPRGKTFKMGRRIKDSVGMKIWKIPNDSGYASIIGVKSGWAKHAHLLEFGTAPRKRSGNNTNGRGGIGGRFKFMMIKKFWNDSKGLPPYLGPLFKKPGSEPYSVAPGDPSTGSGQGAAYHYLETVKITHTAVAEKVFMDTFKQILERKFK